MLWRRLLFLVLLGGLLLSQQVPTASAATPCNWAQFVSDISAPDGSLVAPDAVFTKIWRLKNIGTCTWTTSYSLVFDSGAQMSGATPVNLPKSVAPGQVIDLAATLVAPSIPGHYRGFWELGDAAGTTFGIGSTASSAFWVDIDVQDSSTIAFDMVTFAPYAMWKSGAGVLPFPGTSGDYRGYAQRLGYVTMEDGAFTTASSLLTVPQNKYDGYIQAVYPEFTVQKGDRFQSSVGCEYGSSCYVTYRLDYITSTGLTRTFWSRREMNDARVYQANVDLSPLAGQTVHFMLTMLATGLPDGDRAIWSGPRITRTIPPPEPVTPIAPPIQTTTPTPFGSPPEINPSACDKASFVYDVTVPDGTYFAPGAAFSKTWRLKNSGSCTWTTGYHAIYYSGEQMGAPTSVNLPVSVRPGETIDLTINMVSPQEPGLHRGNWVLSNADGVLFGTGSPAVNPYWLQINVSGGAAGGSSYDFAANACSAQWRNLYGAQPCPGTDGNVNGFVIQQDSPHLEDGTFASLPGLLVAPQSKYDGYIQGVYPTITVQPGDRFQAMVGCEYKANCYVTFRLDYMTPTGAVRNFWSWSEKNDSRFYNADVDLSRLAGQSLRFILTLSAAGYATGDRAIWGAPHIQRAAVTLPATLTPTPSPTIPPPGADWLTYTSEKYGFQFQYPKEAQIEADTQSDNYVKMQLPFAPGTNLREKYMQLQVLENPDVCRGQMGIQEPGSAPVTVVINGISFLKEWGAEGGMMKLYKWVSYTTERDTTCVSFGFLLRSVNPGVYTTPPPVYDEAAESAVFTQIVGSFAWLAQPPTFTPTPTETATPTPPALDWLTYTNAKYGFEFKYPKEGQIVSESDNYTKITLPFTPGTNLGSKYMEARVTEGLSPCHTSLSGLLQSSETMVINGITFLKETGRDAGAGQVYDWVAYSTMHDSSCISLDLVMHSGNIGNYATPPPLFDLAAESAVITQIVSTFSWLGVPPTATDTPVAPSETPTATPPSANWPIYNNARYGFQLKYPEGGQVTNQLDNYARITLPFAGGTNLVEKYLQVYVAENVSPCRSPLALLLPVDSSTTIVLNGVSFLKESGSVGLAGQVYQWTSYSTVQDIACVTLNFVLHSSSQGNYTTPPPPFDEAAERAVFDQVAATFTWLAGPVPPTATDTPTTTPTPVALPDLTISQMRMELEYTTCLLPDHPSGVRIWVVNNGPAPAASFSVRLGDLDQSVAGLGPGETTVLFFKGSQYDRMTVTAAVDSTSVVPESDETNNSRTEMVWLPTPPVPCTPTPTPTAVALTGPYSVVLTGQDLPIRADAGASNPVVGSLAADANNVMRTGPIKDADSSQWVEVVRPDGGTGWVDYNYLTESVSHDTFCADARVFSRITQLQQAMDASNGTLFASLVGSRHGARIAYWRSGTPAIYTTGTAANIFTDPTAVNWGAGPSGTPDVGTFSQIVQPDLTGVLDSAYQLSCDDPSYARMFVNPWLYPNIHYYAVIKPATSGNDLDWKVWLVGFEYVDGQPYIFGTVHYIWEP